MTPPLAHAGHWAAQLLYLAPVIAMVAAIVWAKIRGRGYTDEDEVSSAGPRGNEADDARS
jgi:hypothetical protein